MPSSYTSNKKIEKPAFNDYIDQWQIPVNRNWDFIDKAFGGVSTINLTGLTGVRVLTEAEYQALKIRLTGTPTGNVTVTVPTLIGGMWVVQNDASGSFVESFASAAAPAIIVAAPQGSRTLMTCDGTASGMTLAINSPPTAAGSLTQVQYHGPGGVLTGSPGLVWDNGNSRLTAGSVVALGNNTLGDTTGDILTIGGQHVTTPNGLRFNSDQLYLTDTSTSVQVAIGTTIVDPGSRLTVSGNIKVTGGYTFSDGTTQVTAATGTGDDGVAGANTQVQYNNNGAFGAEAGFTYNQTTNTLAVPVLSLTTALAVTSGGTGVTTSTGTGAGVHATAPALVSPAMSGTPTAPTAAVGTDTSQVATTGFVNAQIANQLGGTRILAKGYFQVTGGTVNVLKSSGASSIVYSAAGKYTVTMSSSAPDTNYTVLVTASGNPAGGNVVIIGFEWSAVSRTTTTFQIGASSGGGIGDPNYMSFVVFA